MFRLGERREAARASSELRDEHVSRPVATQPGRSRLADPGGLAMALLLLALVAIFSFLSWQQYVHYAEHTRHTNEAIGDLNDLVAAVQLAESSQRGYLLTSDALYLEEFRGAVSETRRALSVLNRLSPEVRNDHLLTALRGLISEKLSELESTVALARAHRTEAAERTVRTNSGFHVMLQIRSTERQYENDLQTALRRFREDSRFYARTSQWVSLLGSAGIFLIVFFGNRRIIHLLSTTANLNTELTQVNQELQQFVYSASHDLREPLRTLIIYSQLVDKKLIQGEPISGDLKHIRSAAKLMTQIVEDLMTYTQTANDVINGQERADMRRVFEGVSETLLSSIQESGAELTHGALPTLPIAEVHARILLQNLISNAVKYRKQGERPRVRVHIAYENRAWCLAVTDNGIGIKPEYQQQIFGLFKRLHSRSEYPGTGLGLAICKKIVDRYHGWIELESKVDVGSTFRVRIPDPANP